MASEILAVPEENLAEVVIIIRAGLNAEEVSPEVSERLGAWCDDIEEYLTSQLLTDEEIEEAIINGDLDDEDGDWDEAEAAHDADHQEEYERFYADEDDDDGS